MLAALSALMALNSVKMLSAESNHVTLGTVRSKTSDPNMKTLKSVPPLDRTVHVRAIDALRWLVESAAITYPTSLMWFNKGWAIARYLGVIETNSKHLTLSAAGRQFSGRHRTIVSEDLGIGFGLLAAEIWRRAENHDVVNAVDIDVAIPNGLVDDHGNTLHVSKLGSQRPDFVMSSRGRRSRKMDFHVVECKGISDLRRWSAHDQLVSAASQIDQVAIGPRIPDGLISSTYSGADPWKVAALESVDPPAAGSGLSVAIEDLDWEQIRTARPRVELGRFEFATIRDVRVFAAATLATSFTGLASLAQNRRALETLARSQRDMAQIPPQDRESDEFHTPAGDAVGTITPITYDGTQMEVCCGVLATVNSALTGPAPEAIFRAQDELPNSDPRHEPETAALPAEDELEEQGVWSLGSSGTTIGLRIATNR